MALIGAPAAASEHREPPGDIRVVVAQTRPCVGIELLLACDDGLIGQALRSPARSPIYVISVAWASNSFVN